MYVGEYGKNKIFCVIMDGCIIVMESYFVLILVGKILKKICVEKGYKEFVK